MIIREATLADAETLAMLLTELNRTVGIVGVDREHEKLPEFADVSPQQMEARMQAASNVERQLIAFVDGEAAGFTSVRVIPYLDQDTPYAELTQVHVRPQFRRRGVASQLVRAGEQRAKDAGATCLHILTGTDNENAQAFYRSSGYEVECVDFQKFFERTPVSA